MVFYSEMKENFISFIVLYLLCRVWLFCTPMDCSLPGSSVHGISQARLLDWVAISYSRRSSLLQGRSSSWPRDQICISCISRQILCQWVNTSSSVQLTRSVVSDSLWPHESQHTRLPCPSPTPGVNRNSCASSPWCHPAISSSVVPFSSCSQSLPASESFSMRQLFA